MKKTLLLVVFILFVGLLPSLLQYGCFMQLKDFSTQQIPFLLETKRLLLSGNPYWSWNTFLGANFLGTYSFSEWTSPFVWIVFLFPNQYVCYGITLALFIKFICIGSFSYLFFKEVELSQELSIIGSLMYTFCSYVISTIGYYSFLEPVALFPLLLLGIERYIRKERHGALLLCFSCFLVSFVNYYFLPGAAICGSCYYVFRIHSNNINISNQRISIGLALAILGFLMASFVIFPTVLQMEGSDRVTLHYGISFGHMLERTRALFVPKLLEQHNPLLGKVSGWSANAAYVPVVGLFLALLYIIKSKSKLHWLVIFLLFLYITPLNGVFSLFTNPEYSRWAYCLTFFLILVSLKFIDEGHIVKRKEYVIYSLLSMIVLIASYVNGSRYDEIINKSDYIDNCLILGMFVFSMFLLGVYVWHQSNKMLLICVVIQSIIYVPLRIYMNTDWYHVASCVKGDESKMDKRDYPNIYVINNELQYNVDNKFNYRTEFVTRGRNIYQNMASLKNIPSVNSYNTGCFHHIKRFVSIADTLSNFGYFSPVINIESFDALTSVKEIVVFEDSLRLGEPRTYEGAIQCKGEGYIVYENPFYVPMGFTYDYYMNESLIDSLNAQTPKPDIPLLLLSRLAVKSEDEACVSKYLKKKEDLINEKLDSVAYERKLDACSSFVGNTSGFKATIDNPRDNYVFFSVPYDKGFTAFVDNNKTDIMEVNMGLSAVLVPKGKHQIEFSYMPRGLKMGAVVSLIAFLIACVIIRRDMRAKE